MLKESIIKNHIMNLSKGIESDIEEDVVKAISHLTKAELRSLLIEEEIYFSRHSNKEELINRFVGIASHGIGMKILSMNDIIGESHQDYYGRMYSMFYGS